MRKRVCIDINSALLLVSRGYLTGIGRTTYELVDGLGNLGYELPFDLTLYSQNMRDISSKNLNLPFESKHLNLPHREFINRILSYVPVRTALTKADLWHCPHNSDYVDQISKTIFTIHDLIFLNCENEFTQKQIETMRKLPPLLRKCRAIITCSESSKNDLVNLMQIDPDKIFITYWGIKHEIFKMYPDKNQLRVDIKEKFSLDKPYFFSVSCGYGRKNTLALLEAYRELLKQDPENDLVIIWNNYGQDVQKIISESNGRIRVLSKVTDIELVKLYNCSTASFYPSSYEGFGLPVLEAMACGTPIVTCRNSSLAEIGGDAAIYIDNAEAEALLNVMQQFEENTYDIADLRAAGIDQASRFTWKKCAEETLDIYNKHL